MAKPNYQYEKRQRELEKKKKKAEKALKKGSHEDGATPDDESTGTDTEEEGAPASDAPVLPAGQ